MPTFAVSRSPSPFRRGTVRPLFKRGHEGTPRPAHPVFIGETLSPFRNGTRGDGLSPFTPTPWGVNKGDRCHTKPAYRIPDKNGGAIVISS